MTQKRYEILERNLAEPLDTVLALLKKGDESHAEWTAPGRPHQQFARQLHISKAVIFAVLEHLGYGPIEDLSFRLNRGVDESLEYFFGDWWRDDESDAQSLDKLRPDRSLLWFDVLPHALLLGGLTGRWDDVSKICSWFDESIEMEYRGGMIEDTYMLLFLCIASSLSPTPIPGVGAMLEVVKASRTKRPRLLCALWQATLASDQKAFDKALKESVRHFLKVDAEGAPNPNYWVALHPSFIWLLAERNGFVFPSLKEPCVSRAAWRFFARTVRAKAR